MSVITFAGRGRSRGIRGGWFGGGLGWEVRKFGGLNVKWLGGLLILKKLSVVGARLIASKERQLPPEKTLTLLL